MKKIVTLLAISLALFSCTGKKNDLQRMNLKGKVKSVRQIPYRAVEKFGEVQKGAVEPFGDNMFWLFNEQGNKIEENRYKSDGSLNWKSTYKYDDKGNQIEENSYKSNGSLDSKSTYKYDAKGNEIEKNVYNSDGSLDWKHTYKYDAKGNEIEENWYNSDGSLSWKYTYKYTYDKHGNWIEKIEYNEDNKPFRVTEREIEYYP